MGANKPQKMGRVDHTRPTQPSSNTGGQHYSPASNSSLAYGRSEKRRGDDSREGSRQRSNPSTKRPCQEPAAPTSKLCPECSSICWDGIDEFLDFEGVIDWRGKSICSVGTRYRNAAADAPCPLCRQLRAPWIEPFLERRDPSHWKQNDVLNDEIHIFRNLRHLPHVNDFPSARKILREKNAPYHIAVVPVGQGWKHEIRAHIAENGMVVVMPSGEHCKPEVFAPRQVPKTFNPSVMLSFLKRCKHHENQCRPKPPKVKGLKVIDCRPLEPNIRNYCPGDKYVALSYVWGPPSEGNAPTQVQPPNVLLAEGRGRTRFRALQSISDNPRHKSDSADLNGKRAAMSQSANHQVRTFSSKAMALRNTPREQLPKDVPLTILDAIRVTKALGCQFLWVDKYCIDQDNDDEKQQQCSQMGDIYAGAEITIFGLGEDSNAGLPGVSIRPRRWQQQCTTVGRYKFMYTLQDPHYSIEHSKWSTRAWTYQEGLFSPRRLFFTDQQAYFECNAMNCTEAFSSNLKHLHIQSGRRYKALHRAGNYICGNSNQFSHVCIKQNAANHRKVDIIRRCEYQTRQYTRRELTKKDDALNAYAGIAHFYANTTARIYCLAGLAVPFPIAKLYNRKPEYLDHLSYALAWTHHPWDVGRPETPKPQPRKGFPSWSWAGWVGEMGKRGDLPYCWTSQMSSVDIDIWEGDNVPAVAIEYCSLQTCSPRDPDVQRTLLDAKALSFDAHVLDPRNLIFWKKDPQDPSMRTPSRKIHFHMSIAHPITGKPFTMAELREKLFKAEFECVVLGKHGQPRKNVLLAIQLADRKGTKAKKRRIELFECREPDAMVCLVVHTNKTGVSYRVGLLKVELEGTGIEPWDLGEKRSFLLK